MSSTQQPEIPDHLLVYRDEDWMPQVEPTSLYPQLRARELWRQAQDCWGHEHGVWRAEFEQLRAEQLATRRLSEGGDG